MASPARLRSYLFRGGRPYWAVMVADLVSNQGENWDSQTADTGEGGRDGKLEVWGLTGWYLSLLMKVLEVYR